MMRYGLDILFAALILSFAVVGWKKGFFKALVDFCGALIAMAGAAVFSAPAAQWVYDAFFHDALMEKIAAAITGLGAADAVETVFANFPDVIQRGLAASGITEGYVMSRLQSGTLDAAEGIALAISPMLVGFIRILALVVLFIVFIVLLRALANLLTGLFSLPGLKTLNGLLGAVFGALLAVVVIWVGLACVQSFLPLVKEAWQNRIAQALGESVFFSVLYEFNPAYILLG